LSGLPLNADIQVECISKSADRIAATRSLAYVIAKKIGREGTKKQTICSTGSSTSHNRDTCKAYFYLHCRLIDYLREFIFPFFCSNHKNIFAISKIVLHLHMDLQQIVTLIKVKKKHGLIKRVSEATGVSQPSVRKYLNGDIINPKAMSVIKAALEEVNNAS
jgi:hypothetical protein